MRLGELTYLTDQIVTFGFSSLELRNKAQRTRSLILTLMEDKYRPQLMKPTN